MTNGKKYKDLILKNKDICEALVIEKVLKPNGLDCDTADCVKCQALQMIFLQEEYQEPKTDWSKVAVDMPILVSDTETDGWIKAHFAKVVAGRVYAWDQGKTSFTSNRNECSGWKHAKLAEYE